QGERKKTPHSTTAAAPARRRRESSRARRLVPGCRRNSNHEEVPAMCSQNHSGWRGLQALAVLALLLPLAASGSGHAPGSSRVTYEDGSPLDEGMVICEARDGDKTVMARGPLKKDGTFELGTQRPGDGAPVGKYRVLVVPRSLNQFEI